MARYALKGIRGQIELLADVDKTRIPSTNHSSIWRGDLLDWFALSDDFRCAVDELANLVVIERSEQPVSVCVGDITRLDGQPGAASRTSAATLNAYASSACHGLLTVPQGVSARAHIDRLLSAALGRAPAVGLSLWDGVLSLSGCEDLPRFAAARLLAEQHDEVVEIAASVSVASLCPHVAAEVLRRYAIFDVRCSSVLERTLADMALLKGVRVLVGGGAPSFSLDRGFKLGKVTRGNRWVVLDRDRGGSTLAHLEELLRVGGCRSLTDRLRIDLGRQAIFAKAGQVKDLLGHAEVA